MNAYLSELRAKMNAAVREVNVASADFTRVDSQLVDRYGGGVELRIARRDSQARKDAALAWDHWAAEVTMWAGVINAEVALLERSDR